MSDHPERADASEPLTLLSKPVRVFLLVLALVLRNTHGPTGVQEVLRHLGERADLFQRDDVAKKWSLSPDDVVDLHHLVGVLGKHLKDPQLRISDPSEGTVH